MNDLFIALCILFAATLVFIALIPPGDLWKTYLLYFLGTYVDHTPRGWQSDKLVNWYNTELEHWGQDMDTDRVDIFYPAIHNPPYTVRITDMETGVVVVETGKPGESHRVVLNRAQDEMDRRRGKRL